MRLFIDTNIFVEYFEMRAEFDSVKILFNALEEGIHCGYISVGSFYTLAYIADQGFKRKGYDKNTRLKLVRQVLLEVLNLVTVIEVNNEELRKGICDESFTDLEDSFQHRTALYGKCEAIVTLNVKDFKGVDIRQINVYTPKQFNDLSQN
ncbi:MAG: PIN domain-containing protein [Bacteroidaceae bacterium]|nr:PIN domain-containing protein [Bacteroidaceae bacterium]